jgi:hypothetical protein
MAHALPGLMLRFHLNPPVGDVKRVNAANWVTSLENK